MIEITQGNLLTAPVEALVNTVNTEGIMGKGIALQFKQAYPEMFKVYERACKAGEVQLGQMNVFDLGGLVGGPRWIINFPTKGHWRSGSKISDIKSGLKDLIKTIQRLKIRSIAVPPLGCGYGGLNWNEVKPLIEHAFEELPEVQVQVFAPSGIPDAKTMPNRTRKPEITEGRAALIIIIHKYLQGLLDPFVTLLEVHKLMYFLQEAGQPLKLKYEANKFGPYAANLRHVLEKLEGHYLTGYGDGQDNPSKPIELKSGAVEAASATLVNHTNTLKRLQRVALLIDGFEDSYGLELLSSVHWVMCHNDEAKTSALAAVNAVHAWNERKCKVLKSEHLIKAWERLKHFRWDNESEGIH